MTFIACLSAAFSFRIACFANAWRWRNVLCATRPRSRRRYEKAWFEHRSHNYKEQEPGQPTYLKFSLVLAH